MSTSINTAATVVVGRSRDVEEAAGVVNDSGQDQSADNTNGEPPTPLCQSSRVKGYILLLVSAGLNFASAWRLHRKHDFFLRHDLADINWCVILDNLSSFYDFVALRRLESEARIRFAVAAACMTIIISGFVLLCYIDLCTSLRRTLWPKVIEFTLHFFLCHFALFIIVTYPHSFSDVWSK
jgi:hypothetical protein